MAFILPCHCTVNVIFNLVHLWGLKGGEWRLTGLHDSSRALTPAMLLLLLLSRFSRVRLLATPWTEAHQAPPSMGFSRQEYWSGVPLPSLDSLHGFPKKKFLVFSPHMMGSDQLRAFGALQHGAYSFLMWLKPSAETSSPLSSSCYFPVRHCFWLGSQVAHWYSPMDRSLPGSSVQGIFQAKILEWVAISFSWGSSQTRDQTWVSCLAGSFFTNWATREAM